jgi:ferredoxin
MVAPERSQLTGAVEVDETYVGGADAGRRGGRDSLGAAEIVIVAVEVRGLGSGVGEARTGQEDLVVGGLAAEAESLRFPHLRVEACDSCHHYLIGVDLGRDAQAVPVVDELASLPFDLHAKEHVLRMAQITPGTRYGFFTDTSVCIGCKACEVACKEWNQLQGNEPTFLADSFDNTGQLDAQNWRHVRFVEHVPDATTAIGGGQAWLMMSDVCKHCQHASCMEVCPTGAIIRTETTRCTYSSRSATAAATASRPAPMM